ncbi:hypothetical protein [Polaribacter glomeratus]|uniref:Uncharacterized protein n=1 Tax=Polaribacter glomeratus TaxID=102 RepID=A0A2S7WID7_9FLAO|nr:hypothetical protein [Polaribacter glomeratus]PQJ77363.1 hypothetical protein BTO16_16160 [Polaribacter glomeratus]TXD65950.1 hypothetical protein ESX12_07265 [Polaribacter glomeratus]
MKYIQFLILIFIVSFIFNCKSKDLKNPKEETKINVEVTDTTKEIYNENKSLLLILNYNIDGNLPTTFYYTVVDVKTKTQKKEGVFIGTKIEWLDMTSLKCFNYIGMIEKEPDEFSGTSDNNSNNDFIIIKI